jgi:hypothetical protein
VHAASAARSDAALAYERVRAAVLGGQARPDALGAFAFHGMWHAMRVLASTAERSTSLTVPPTTSAGTASTFDRQFVRLLADMVLATQLEVLHAH